LGTDTVLHQQQITAAAAAATHAQVVSECSDESGVLVGFWCPPYVGSNLNVPGFHFHFLSDDRQRGGHMLQLKMEQGTAWLQEVRLLLHVHVAVLPTCACCCGSVVALCCSQTTVTRHGIA
jgi:alpha-acetolactate decarboxylase